MRLSLSFPEFVSQPDLGGMGTDPCPPGSATAVIPIKAAKLLEIAFPNPVNFRASASPEFRYATSTVKGNCLLS